MYIFPCVPHLANHPDFQVIWSLSYLSSVISFSPSLSQSTSISFRPCFQAPPSHLLFYMDLSLPFHSWSLPSCSVMSLLASFSVTPLTSSCNYYYKKKKRQKCAIVWAKVCLYLPSLCNFRLAAPLKFIMFGSSFSSTAKFCGIKSCSSAQT